MISFLFPFIFEKIAEKTVLRRLLALSVDTVARSQKNHLVEYNKNGKTPHFESHVKKYLKTLEVQFVQKTVERRMSYSLKGRLE